MNKHGRLLSLTLALAFFLAGCNRPGTASPRAEKPVPDAPAEKFILLYATGIVGELVDCGCPGHPRGGLARRAAVASGLADANPGRFLHVDGGNAFFNVPSPQAVSDEQKKRARVIARSFAHMRIDAVNVGARELAAGLPFLRDELARAGETELPLVSANVIDPATGRPAFPPSREFKVGDRRVCVFGITEQVSGDPSAMVSPPAAAAQAAISELKPKCDLVVGLYAMPLHAASELARQVPGADLVIVSHPSSAPAPKPLVLGDTVLAQAGSRGMYLGRLDLALRPRRPAGKSDLSGEQRAQLEAELGRVVAQLKILEGDIAQDPQLSKVFERAREDEARLRGQLGQAATSFEYENALLSLDLNLPEESQIAGWVAEAGVVAPKSKAPAVPPPAPAK